nr:tyrosine-type recombinase/integrase [Noviherbaspirillum saxi]
MALQVKDIDFERRVIIVRQGKGGKDRVVMLQDVLKPALREPLGYARALWQADRQANLPGVYLPHALEATYPRADGGCLRREDDVVKSNPGMTTGSRVGPPVVNVLASSRQACFQPATLST